MCTTLLHRHVGTDGKDFVTYAKSYSRAEDYATVLANTSGRNGLVEANRAELEEMGLKYPAGK